jgi:pimeloyl-ACP methyl ester carboxylesterase
MNNTAPSSALEQLEPTKHLLPNGVELHTVRAGHGPSVVFIHGAMGDWRSWAPQWPAFTEQFDCISYSRRYSFPNHNTMASPHHSALDEAEDLRQLLDLLGLQRCILVGSSYGGFTALALAVSHPERVQALVAVEPPMMKYALLTPEGQAIAAEFRARVIEPANAAFRAGDDLAASRIMTGGINGAASPVTDGEAMQRRLQNMRAMKMLALSSDEFPLLAPEALAALPMPVMLLSGGQTEAVHRAIFEQLCLHMPQARSLRVEGAGHGVTREQAQVFNTRVLEFLHASVKA